MARCRRRGLLCAGCLAMAVCLWWVVWLERSAAASATATVDTAQLAVALGAWCLAYELSVGSGYFVVVSDLASGPSATLTYAVGNSVRFAGEFASSLLFLSAVDAFGITRTLGFHAVVSCALVLLLLAVLPETNPRFRVMSDTPASLVAPLL